jgi:hypothetical protein
MSWAGYADQRGYRCLGDRDWILFCREMKDMVRQAEDPMRLGKSRTRSHYPRRGHVCVDAFETDCTYQR